MNQRLQRTAVSILAFFVAPSSASAASVLFTLEQNSFANTFEIYAEAQGSDNFGLASYSLLLNGTITSLDHRSPNLVFANGLNGAGPAGFTLFRSADNAATLGASQDTVAPTPNLIKGFGQTANSFAGLGMTPLVPPTDPVSWDARLLIASGTYAGANPTFNVGSVEVFANVFSSAVGAGTIAADLRFGDLCACPILPPVGLDATLNDIMSGAGMTLNFNFQATDTETPEANLVWSNLQFSGQPGNGGDGTFFAQPTLGPNGAFSWNLNGAARGVYTAVATVRDDVGLTDTATLTINVTKVPEPATIVLYLLTATWGFAIDARRHRALHTHERTQLRRIN